MSGNVKVCSITPELLEKLKKLRLSQAKINCAIVCKVDVASQTVVLEEEHEDITIDELREELPSHQPRYVILSYVYHHDDGRVSYPLVFIFISPSGCKPELQMMYAGSKLELVQQAGLTKVFELRSTEELTEEWLLEKLKLFR